MMNLVQGNLNKIIQEKGLVKKGVAKRAGISAQNLSDILMGRKVIRADMIPALARAVDVPIPDLFKEEQKGA